ncbi:major facilitator superfamily [Colletotrichum karsti]|uniref:Major facilitator superfamily n=1 Tax=Colletotrichum karsti TaxID=1095194 RepID=A0A9P6I673_9PEZI|nr:major facilitator superfamily [Colletotrichum karsti]KAF9874701.1 major facilitator superfamily [Colletotrichum karsti]
MDAKDDKTHSSSDINLEFLPPVDLTLDFENKKDGIHDDQKDGEQLGKQDTKPDGKRDDKQDARISDSVPSPTSDVPLGEADTQAESGPTQKEDEKLKKRARWALFVMAFFMGDVQDGLGPFLGVYLQQHGWAPGLRGSVSTAGGVATIVAAGPIGALIDATKKKRLLVAAFALLVGVSQGLNLLSTHPALVFTTQIVSAVAGTSMVPLLVALTLGICSQQEEDDRGTSNNRGNKKRKDKHSFRALNGRNQASNHAGNMVSAGLAGLLGSHFGLTAVFWLVMAFCAATMVCVFLLPERAIDHAAARAGPPSEHDVSDDSHRQDMQERGRAGIEDPPRAPNPPRDIITIPKEKTNTFSKAIHLFRNNRSLGVIAITVFLFHLGNAAILYLYGQALVAAGQGDPAGTTGLTVIIAQGTMVVVSILTSWVSGRRGYWLAILTSYAVLPIRAAVAGKAIKSWGVWPVQILDGIGAGIQSVAIPGLLAVMMAGSGHFNVTFGIVGGMTRQTGAAISHSLGGWMAQDRGYSFALYVLGVFPLASLALWIGFYRMLLRPQT